jgi:hypothetical protein
MAQEPQKTGKLRQEILEYDDIVIEIVTVPEWGGKKVEVRGMSSKERAKLLKASALGGEGIDMEKWYPDLLIATCFDPKTGEKVFDRADRAALNEKSGAAISGLADVAARLSGLGESDVAAAKEELQEES